uniref:Transcription factor 25 n=1 Tax=Hirondellea gigas TaxID=1518452 RepID=A0A6A7G795_9CRUS
MSTRRIRKLQKVVVVEADGADIESSESDRELNAENVNRNHFSFLIESDDDSTDSDHSEISEEKNSINVDDSSRSVNSTTTIIDDQIPSNQQKKKKKKSRKRKPKPKSKPSKSSKSSFEEINEQKKKTFLDNDNENDDDSALIESEMKRLECPKDELKINNYESLFQSNPRDFNSEIELSRMFGKDVVYSNRESQQSERMSKSRQQQQKRKGRIRRTTLIRPGNQWPNLQISGIQGGLSMELLSTDQYGLKHFSWIYSGVYEHAEQLYESRARTHDPEQIVYLLNDYPYHVNTLLQMAEILKQHGQISEAATCVEQALYRFECSFHPSFSFTKGNCRMSYDDNAANRSFFLCLYRHIQFLGRKGCPQTALSFSKLLLSLDPENDHLCSLLSLDFYAIRSKEYQFLFRFSSEFSQNGNSIRILPNFAYSSALCRWFLDEKSSNLDEISSVKCDLENSSSLSPSSLLFQAILLFPEVIRPLISKCNSRLLNTSRLKSILKHRHFVLGKLRRQENSAIKKLVSLFVERSHTVWKADEILEWLIVHCESVINALQSSSISTYSSFDDFRDSIYSAKTPNRYAKLDIGDFSDVITTLPPDELPQPIRPQVPFGIDIDGQSPLEGMNALAGFLVSLLPWVSTGPNANGQQHHQHQDPADDPDDHEDG